MESSQQLFRLYDGGVLTKNGLVSVCTMDGGKGTMFCTMLVFLLQNQEPKSEGPSVLVDPDRVVQATLALHVGLANEGSGVIVGRRGEKLLALSAAHLFKSQGREAHATLFTPGNPPKAGKQLLEVEVLESWPEIDLVLLALESPSLPPFPLQLAPARSLPGKYRGAIHSSGCDKGFPGVRGEMLIAKVLTTKNSGENEAFYWEVADPSIPGRSGGPLVDTNGKLLGICSGTDRKGKGMYVHIDEIRAALKRKGFSAIIYN
ncbi:MAG: serine protease [Planctomycetota bacterium]|nr:MAG: serine protease [Planctomycetota bacterium]